MVEAHTPTRLALPLDRTPRAGEREVKTQDPNELGDCGRCAHLGALPVHRASGNPEVRGLKFCSAANSVLTRKRLARGRDRGHLCGVRVRPTDALDDVLQRTADRHIVNPRLHERIPPFVEGRVGQEDGRAEVAVRACARPWHAARGRRLHAHLVDHLLVPRPLQLVHFTRAAVVDQPRVDQLGVLLVEHRDALAVVEAPAPRAVRLRRAGARAAAKEEPGRALRKRWAVRHAALGERRRVVVPLVVPRVWRRHRNVVVRVVDIHGEHRLDVLLRHLGVVPHVDEELDVRQLDERARRLEHVDEHVLPVVVVRLHPHDAAHD
eukprot:2662880-Prymnesium_polylepis.1